MNLSEQRKFFFRLSLSGIDSCDRHRNDGGWFDGKNGQVALDQLRCIDKNRLVKKLGTAPDKTALGVSAILTEMFTM